MARETGQVALIQFAKAPLQGRVKTRMMPHLTAWQACELHCELVLWTSRQLVDSKLGEVELSVAGDAGQSLFQQCRGLGVSTVSQQRGPDLGQRMYRAIHRGLSRSAKVILVGSDCPAIDREYLGQAVRALDTAPVVLGPAMDGGYVLIGASQIQKAVFDGIPWGTAEVYGKTLARLRQLGLDWMALPLLADIDRPEDLALWRLLRDRDG